MADVPGEEKAPGSTSGSRGAPLTLVPCCAGFAAAAQRHALLLDDLPAAAGTSRVAESILCSVVPAELLRELLVHVPRVFCEDSSSWCDAWAPRGLLRRVLEVW